MTIVLVSHSMDDVAEYVNRIVVMDHGRKMYDDAPREVFRHVEELEAMGLAAPQVPYMMHQLRKNGFDVNPDAITIEEAQEEVLKALEKRHQNAWRK